MGAGKSYKRIVIFVEKIREFKIMKKYLLLAFIFAALAAPVMFASAAGAIDPANVYAWAPNAGWINFGCTNCNAQITDSAITGRAWSDNYGWVYLDCADTPSADCTHPFGVTNTPSGELGGEAWSPNSGWVYFNGVNNVNISGTLTSETSSASINNSGQFTGVVWGDNTKNILFDNCGSNCGVSVTSWLPAFTRIPVATPIHGIYALTQSVSLSAPTDEGTPTIVYTTDGSTPDCTPTGTVYSSPISVSATETIKAIACLMNN